MLALDLFHEVMVFEGLYKVMICELLMTVVMLIVQIKEILLAW